MTLKRKIRSLDDVDESLRSHYTQDGDEFVLSVDGADGVTRDDLNRLREALSKRTGEAIGKALREGGGVAGMSRDELAAAVSEAVKARMAGGGGDDGGGGGGGGKGGSATDDPAFKDLQREMAAQREELDRLRQERDASAARAKEMTISGALTAAATATNATPASIPNLTALLAREFETTAAGEVRTREGSPWGSDLTAQDVMRKVQTSDAFAPFWPNGVGGGAGGGGGGGGDGFENNPWSKDHWNMMEQGRAIRSDRAKAEEMAKAAGSFIGATAPKAA